MRTVFSFASIGSRFASSSASSSSSSSGVRRRSKSTNGITHHHHHKEFVVGKERRDGVLQKVLLATRRPDEEDATDATTRCSFHGMQEEGRGLGIFSGWKWHICGARDGVPIFCR